MFDLATQKYLVKYLSVKYLLVKSVKQQKQAVLCLQPGDAVAV